MKRWGSHNGNTIANPGAGEFSSFNETLQQAVKTGVDITTTKSSYPPMDHQTYPSSLPYVDEGKTDFHCPSPLGIKLFHFHYSFFAFLAAFLLFLQLSRRRVHRSKTLPHSYSRNAFLRAKAFAEPERVPRNYPNNKATVMRACRAPSHDF